MLPATQTICRWLSRYIQNKSAAARKRQAKAAARHRHNYIEGTEEFLETVFIADDEQAIREGLKYIIDWGKHDYKIIGDASNGADALTKIVRLKPSLVLIDIRMPKMHGIEVIKEAKQLGFEGKVIILSGYSDFKYAQEAIKLGVEFYLTKPIDEEELEKTIDKLHDDIIADRQKSTAIMHFQEKARREILDDIISGTAVLSTLDLGALALTENLYQLVIYEQFEQKETSIPYQFSELLRVTNDRSGTFDHLIKDGKNVIVLKGRFALDKFNRFLDHYNDQEPEKGSPLDTLFLAYSKPVASLEELPWAYEQVRSLISRRFFCEQGQHTLGYDNLPDASAKDRMLGDDLKNRFSKQFVDYIQAFNRKMIASTIYDLTELLFNADAQVKDIRLFVTDIILQVKNTISSSYPSNDIPFPSNAEIIGEVEAKFYLYEIMNYLSSIFELIMNSIGNSSRDSILDDILYYIDHNYQNNIKLETIAPLFGYNSAYLGKIFSKTVGENFNNYIDKVRIMHAKELIVDNKLKVYEIAEQIGYKNVDYFHKKFKKYVSLSPAEYRKRILAGEEVPDIPGDAVDNSDEDPED